VALILSMAALTGTCMRQEMSASWHPDRNDSLTPCSRVLTGSHSDCQVNSPFLTEQRSVTSACQYPVNSRLNPVHTKHPTSSGYILILSLHLRLRAHHVSG